MPVFIENDRKFVIKKRSNISNSQFLSTKMAEENKDRQILEEPEETKSPVFNRNSQYGF